MATLYARFYGRSATDLQGHKVPAGFEPGRGDETSIPGSITVPKGAALVRLFSDVDTFLEWGTSPAAGAIPIVAGSPEFFGCAPGQVIYVGAPVPPP